MRLVITDLDGTLIDHHTYSAEAARPALAALRAAGVPLVLCSSKTLAEMQGLARALHLLPAPLIVENGGAVWFPEGWPGGGGTWVLGWPAATLADLLGAVAAEAAVAARGFSAMTDEEVAERTGLGLDVAHLARQRQYSEPFVCLGAPDLTTLDAVARRYGARVTRGGRFFHLTGPTDKGTAVRVVRDRCPPGTRTLGLGDAPNDMSLLLAVDDAAVVPQPGGGLHPDLLAAVPGARRAPEAGPTGWNAVVLAWLADTRGEG